MYSALELGVFPRWSWQGGRYPALEPLSANKTFPFPEDQVQVLAVPGAPRRRLDCQYLIIKHPPKGVLNEWTELGMLCAGMNE